MRSINTFIIIVLSALVFGCNTRTIQNVASSHNNMHADTNSTISLLPEADPYDTLRFEDHGYLSSVRSVRFHQSGLWLSLPILHLNTNEKLSLSFDELDADSRNLSLQIIHCNADWEPSRLSESEYIDGFVQGFMLNYDFSQGASQSYIHYWLNLPNEHFRITKSGNYLVHIYDEEQQVYLLTKRFFVVESKVKINGQVNNPSIYSYRFSHQEVDFTVRHSGLIINNPYEEIKTIVMQNGNWLQTKSLKPAFIKNEELVYDYNEENVFQGGREFRNFDFKSFRYRGERVRSIDSYAGKFIIDLHDDAVTSYKKYVFWNDINGQHTIQTDDGINPDLEADYAHVQFNLRTESIYPNGKIYVFGALSSWACLPKFEMTYDFESNMYTCDVLLKQGYYNYQYLYIDTAQTNKPLTSDVSVIEGSSAETENNYQIFVYYRNSLQQYDELIGIEQFKSRN